MMVDTAADWCSQHPRCRGFTVSAEVHDDRLLWVRFSAVAAHVLSNEWVSYFKEPEQSFAYSFTPGHLVSLAGAPALHEEWASLTSAHAYCDAEPRCAGFSLATADDGAKPAPVAWVTFQDASATKVAFSPSQVSYLKADGEKGGGAEARAAEQGDFELQPGYLGGAASGPLRQASTTVEEARRWCAARAVCGGFSVASDADEAPGHRLDVTWWGTAQLLIAPGWVSYVRTGGRGGGGAAGARYVLQPGYLTDEGVVDDESVGGGTGGSSSSSEAVMSVSEARWWCDRRPRCGGFTLNVAVAHSEIASRTDADNARAVVRFSSSGRVGAYVPASAGWVSYAKVDRSLAGGAANAAVAAREPSSPLSWLLQPGFVLRYVEEMSDGMPGHDQLLRQDEQVALGDLVAWCAAESSCEGLTASHPRADRLPSDRLASTAAYCCGAQVRTSAAQFSLTKWSPPAAQPQQQQRQQPEVSEEEQRGAAASEAWPASTFVPQLGYVAGGRALHEGFMTTAQAARWCAEKPECHGFSTRAPALGSAVASVTYVTLSTADEVVHHREWYAWVKPRARHDNKQEL